MFGVLDGMARVGSWVTSPAILAADGLRGVTASWSRRHPVPPRPRDRRRELCESSRDPWRRLRPSGASRPHTRWRSTAKRSVCGPHTARAGPRSLVVGRVGPVAGWCGDADGARAGGRPRRLAGCHHRGATTSGTTRRGRTPGVPARWRYSSSCMGGGRHRDPATGETLPPMTARRLLAPSTPPRMLRGGARRSRGAARAARTTLMVP